MDCVSSYPAEAGRVVRVLKFSLLFAAAVSLSGCLIVPYEAPQGSVGPRQDVPAAVPDTIVKGKTTRDEVLRDEGKPDFQGDAADWFVYASASKESGLGLFFCAAANSNAGCGDARRQVWDYRRLVVRFDAAGVVSDVHVDSASCLRWTRNYGSPVPCLDLRGDDLRREDALATVEKGKNVLTTYQSVRWPADQENDCTFYGELIVTQAALYFVADTTSPVDRKLDQVDPARCPEPDSVVSFDDAEIADLTLVKGMSGDRTVKLSRKDGSHLSFQFLPEEEYDEDDRLSGATWTDSNQLAEDIKKAIGKAPESFGGLTPAAGGVPRTYDQIRWCSGWDPPTIPIVERQIPCERPKDGYLILTATGFMFQLADAGDGLKGLVAGEYADMRSVGIRDSGLLGSYSHWVVVETKDGEIDAFDPGDSDRKIEINSILQSHLPKPPQELH